MKDKRILCLLFAVLLPLYGCSHNPSTARVGKVLPQWEEGWLDIHSINSGRGESFLYIMPDGTTMLLDASGSLDQEHFPIDPPICPALPSPEVSPGRVIINYLKHFMPEVSGGKIDYCMVSHYHGDHFGAWRSKPEKAGIAVHPEGGFQVWSLGEVAAEIPVGMFIDRGPFDGRVSKDYFTKEGIPRYENYRRIIDWCAKTYGSTYEPLKVGYDDQIVLRHNPARYPSFRIMNIAASGYVWTGKDHQVDSTLLPSPAECLSYGSLEDFKIKEGCPSLPENNMSCVIQLDYGLFNYFSGGDIQYKHRSENPVYDIETPISKVVGKVEVEKLSHHGTSGANAPELLNVLRPDVALACNWRDVQPNPKTISYVYAANPDVKLIATNYTEANAKAMREGGVPLEDFLAVGGHVVFRVAPGGDRYWVIILDDTNEEYRVKAVHGPYPCQ